VTVFVQGALGGQIGSIRGTHRPARATAWAATPTSPWNRTRWIRRSARTSPRAHWTILRDDAETVTNIPLSMVSAQYHARVENTLFQLAFIIKVIGPHDLVGYDPNNAIDVGNQPWLPLRATYLQIGPLGLVTVRANCIRSSGSAATTAPGPGVAVQRRHETNQPDFANAPQPPYMRDLVLAHAGREVPDRPRPRRGLHRLHRPAYNYVLSPVDPYLTEADGDHYEEVYSLGPSVEAHAVHPILQLLQYRKP